MYPYIKHTFFINSTFLPSKARFTNIQLYIHTNVLLTTELFCIICMMLVL